MIAKGNGSAPTTFVSAVPRVTNRRPPTPGASSGRPATPPAAIVRSRVLRPSSASRTGPAPTAPPPVATGTTTAVDQTTPPAQPSSVAQTSSAADQSPPPASPGKSASSQARPAPLGPTLLQTQFAAGSGGKAVMERRAPQPLRSPTGATSASLQDTFRAFCGAGKCEMDGRTFVKACRDSGLIDKTFSATDADLLFSKVVPKGQRRLCFQGFLEALALVATKKGAELDDIKHKFMGSAGPTLNGTVADSVRFHDDKTTYTGVHVNGGPESVAKGGGTSTQLASASMRQAF